MPLARTTAIVAGAALALTSCSSPSGPGTSVAAGRPAAPSSSTSISYYSQPIALTITTGVATGGAAATTTVEVATDAAFASMVTTQAVTADASGHATLMLDHLNPATTYYWRVKTTAPGNPGALSQVDHFSVGPILVIQSPTLVQPLADTYPHKRATFTVTNATHTGPDATLTYRFDVATDAAFGNVVVSATVPETATQTSFTPGVDLTPGTTYYWRARASDLGKGVTGAASGSQPFTTVFPEDGASRYTLAIHAPTYCLTHNTHSDYCGGTAAWDPSDYSIDGTLTGASDTFQFAAASPSYHGEQLTLGFTRLNNRLSGAISGATDYPLPSPGLLNAVSFDGVVTGNTDNAGHFTGTFDGGGQLMREGFPCVHYVGCSTSGFSWTLTPH